MTGAGSAATCTAGCGAGAGAGGCGVSPGTGAGATATGSAGGVIPGSAISTSGKSSDVADDGVVSTAFVICKSSGEFEVAAAATGAGIDTIFGPPINGVAVSGGAMLRITSESGNAFASINRSRTRCRISSASRICCVLAASDRKFGLAFSTVMSQWHVPNLSACHQSRRCARMNSTTLMFRLNCASRARSHDAIDANWLMPYSSRKSRDSGRNICTWK